VAEVLTPNGAADSASAGETVTVRLSEDVDVSRGDMFVAADAAATAKKLTADLCWFDDESLNPRASTCSSTPRPACSRACRRSIACSTCIRCRTKPAAMRST
jgi:sulfate adenylyltransferase subunit 1 (EFTu-like GTPase family)